MLLPRFDKPLQRRADNRAFKLTNEAKIVEIKSLLQRRYKQTEIAEMLGMSNSALSDFMAYHGLSKPKK